MEALTLKEWNERGRRIKKGSRSVGKNKQGVSLFSKEQTWEPDGSWCPGQTPDYDYYCNSAGDFDYDFYER